MNREQLLRELQDVFSRISIDPLLIKELIRLIVGSGFEQKFLALFRTRILRLLECGVGAISDKEFESIGQGLFSMHLTGSGFNIRILYSFLPDQTPMLLLAFYERAGKRKTNYTPHIVPALDRLCKAKEDFQNG